MSQQALGQLNPNSVASITGSANVNNATIVPNLQAINDGRDFTITTDTGILNQQQTIVNDFTIYDRIQNWQYPQSVSNNQIVLLPTLMGHCDTKNMYIGGQFSVQVSYTGTNAPTTGTQWSQVIDLNTPYSFFQPTEGNCSSNWSFPEQGIARTMSRVQVYLGNNSQMIQRQNMNYAQHFAALQKGRKYHTDDYMALGNWGSWNTTSSRANLPDLPFNSYDMTTGGDANWDSCFDKAWIGLLDWIKRYCSTVAGTALATSFVIPFPKDTAFPLYFVNSFFEQNQSLPPGTKMRIEIFTQPNYVTVMLNNSAYGYSASLPTAPSGTITIKMQLTNAIFNCVANTLTQTAAASLNSQWALNPMTYVYNTYEYVTQAMDGTTTNWQNINVCTNQQRPTDIFLRMLYEGPDLTTGIVINTNIYPYNNCTYPNVAYGNWRINISGRLGYENRYLNDQTNPLSNQDWQGNINDLLNMAINKDTWRNPDEIFTGDMDRFSSVYNSIIPCISTNPGSMQSAGFYSADKGAVSMTLSIEIYSADTRTAVPATCVFYIYKKLQEQLLIDIAGTSTIIQWPAIKTNGNNVKIPITFNQN